MLSRAVRLRLVVFAAVTVVILAITAVSYVQLPSLLGYGRMTVTADFADASGLYANAIVTYRGAEVGKVTALDLQRDGVRVRLQIDDSERIPADSVAAIHSTSAIGEQDVDLTPTAGGTALLHDGSVIPRSHTVRLQSSSQVIDSLDRLVRSVPTARLARTLDDLSTAFGGTGPALRRLLDSSTELLDTAQANLGPTVALLRGLNPLLRTQQDLAGDTSSSLANLSSFTHQLVLSNDDIVSLLDRTPTLTKQIVGLEQDVSPSLNLLLANLVSNLPVLNVYDPAVRQILTVYPALVSGLLAFAAPQYEKTGKVELDFRLNLGDPPICTKGFLSSKTRRSPFDLSKKPLVSGLYCKESSESAAAVRGARNLQCLNNPGHRAATPAACLGLSEPAADSSRPAVTAGSSGGTADDRTAATRSVPIGSVAYQRDGTIVGPDGTAYTIGEVAPADGKEKPSWRDLLLRPIGRR